METRYLNEDHPVVIGLAGKAGTGKTCTANYWVGSTVRWLDEELALDHYSLASPLHEMVAIKNGIEGTYAKDRQLYAIHALLLEILGGNPLWGAPPYDELIALTKEIEAMYLPEGKKARSFMQFVGEKCRGYNSECFLQYLNRSILRGFKSAKETARFYAPRIDGFHVTDEGPPEHNEDPPIYCSFVSDIRYTNEAEFIRSQPNGILVKLVASDETREQRLLDRDGHVLSTQEASHPSENIEAIPNEWFDAIITTDELTVEQQARIVLKNVLDTFGVAKCLD